MTTSQKMDRFLGCRQVSVICDVGEAVGRCS